MGKKVVWEYPYAVNGVPDIPIALRDPWRKRMGPYFEIRRSTANSLPPISTSSSFLSVYVRVVFRALRKPSSIFCVASQYIRVAANPGNEMESFDTLNSPKIRLQPPYPERFFPVLSMLRYGCSMPAGIFTGVPSSD